jgi:hypothetical protein
MGKKFSKKESAAIEWLKERPVEEQKSILHDLLKLRKIDEEDALWDALVALPEHHIHLITAHVKKYGRSSGFFQSLRDWKHPAIYFPEMVGNAKSGFRPIASSGYQVPR